MARLEPRRFIGPIVFKIRDRLCSSCSGRGTGLVCSACCRSVAEERDSLLRLLRTRNEECAVGWFIVDPEGVIGAYESESEAEAARVAMHKGDPEALEETQVAEIGFLPSPLSAGGE